MKLIFCGLPFVGKTFLGKKMAEKWSYPFIDIDQKIEARHFNCTGSNKSCREIYLERGESYFRKIESDVIEGLQTVGPCVIALGGGSLLKVENRFRIQALGTLIYLKADLEKLWERISKSPPPAYFSKEDPKKSFYDMASFRIPHFEALADLTIEMDSNFEDQLAKIDQGLKIRG